MSSANSNKSAKRSTEIYEDVSLEKLNYMSSANPYSNKDSSKKHKISSVHEYEAAREHLLSKVVPDEESNAPCKFFVVVMLNF